jgi:O-antigen ligase
MGLQLYVLVHLLLRSFSNGVDRMYGTQLSLALSLLAIAVAAVFFNQLFRHRFDRRIHGLLLASSLFAGVSLISLLVSDFVTDAMLDEYQAWYAFVRYVYLISIIMLLTCVYQQPSFCLNVHRMCMVVLAVDASVGIAQYLAGNTILVTQYDKFARVIGLSSHPVTYSLELVLLFCICELTRRKLQWAAHYFHVGLYALGFAALILSASRTGVGLLGATLAIYLLVRRPLLLPLFAVAGILVLIASPFEQLFSELQSIPDYITSGDYTVWDVRTAITSMHWRIHHWYYLSNKALELPWLGFGPGQEPLYSPFALLAHSQFVEVFFETGLLGLIAFGHFWLRIAGAAVSASPESGPASIRNSHDADARTFWIAMFVGLTWVGLFDQSLNDETVSLSFLLLSVFVMLAPASAIAQVPLRRLIEAGPAGTCPPLR